MVGSVARGIASVLLVAVLAVACDRGRSEADHALAARSIDSLLREHFTALEQGDLDKWAGILEPDVFFNGAGPADVLLSRDTVLGDMKRGFSSAFASGLVLEIETLEDTVLVTSKGMSAVAVYLLRYKVTLQDRTYPYLRRASYLMSRDRNGWHAAAVQYSRPVAYDSLFLALMSHKVPRVTPLPEQTPGLPEDLATQFRRDVENIGQATFAPGGGVVVTPAAIETGAQGVRDLAEWLGPAGNSARAVDPIRGSVNSDSTTAWATANISVPIFAGPESATAPMRALFVYVRDGSRWEILHASVSVAWLEES